MKSLVIFFAFGVLVNVNIFAQNQLTLRVIHGKTKEAIIGASVVVKGTTKGSVTDTAGEAILSNLPKNGCILEVSFVGFTKAEFKVSTDNYNSKDLLEVILNPETTNLGEITVTAMRNNSRIDDTPTNVEVLGQEEMTEEGSIKPGNIVSLLGDIAGVQMHQTSETSGNTSARIQGMNGRYTQILRDGIPLFGGYSGSFSLLQIPPLDLRQIEIIKGTSSTLYGSGAISGIINLVSKQPGNKTEGNLVLNQTTLNETDLNGFVSGKNHSIGYTLFTGYVGQKAVDINKDNFSDVPRVRSYTIHPRLFFDFDNNALLSLGLTSTFEQREGGDMYVVDNNINSSHTYFVKNLTARNNVDIDFEKQCENGSVFSCKGAIGFVNRSVETPVYFFQGHQVDYYGEASYSLKGNLSDFIFGISTNGQKFVKTRGADILIGESSIYTTGLFVQNDTKITEQCSVETGLRCDYISDDHAFVLPRVSLMYKFTPRCYLRLNGGMGYKVPDVFSYIDEETELNRYRPSNLKNEIAKNGNVDVNYKIPFDETTTLTVDQSFFYTLLNRPVDEQKNTDGTETLVNKDKPVENYGTQTYVRLMVDELEFYLSYVYTRARKKYDTVRPSFLATPEHNAALMIALDLEDGWRTGLDMSYYGTQIIENNAKTPAYIFTAAMLAKQINKFTIVLNCENIFNYRQKDYMTITGTMPVFKTLWAPVEGRVANISVNYEI